ncbi:unnamed protein product [Lathyrus sativus]|nr:unnamed protein product [Lathyrus sativus]
MESNSIKSTSSIPKSNQSNKENVPPVCKNKISISQIAPSSSSFKSKNKKKVIQRKLKRVPLADITNLCNISSASSSTSTNFTLSHQQPLIGVSISWKGTPKPFNLASKSLRMEFR